MLESLRKGVQSVFIKALLAVLVLSFAAWGIGPIFRGGGSSAVAVIGDVEIGDSYFTRAYRREFQRVANALGGRLESQQAREMGLVEVTLQQIIGRTLLDLAASDLGLTAAKSDVQAIIGADPAFSNSSGRFDLAVYRQTLASNGFDPATYEAATVRDMTREQLVGAVTSGGAVPATLLDRLYSVREERRVAELLVIANDSITEVREPDEADLEVYHREHAPRFTAPEDRDLSFATITAEGLVSEISVSEEEIREVYDSRIDEFDTAERREVEQLLFQDKSRAEQAWRLLRDGRTVADVGKATQSLTASEPSLGEVTRNGLPAEVADKVFSLVTGAASEPLKSPFGWHVFRVIRISPRHTKTIEDVRASLSREIALERAADALFEFSNRIEDEFAGGASLAEAASRLGLTLTRVAAIDRRGRDRSGRPVASVPALPEFLEVAFSTSADAEPALHEAESGAYFLLGVHGITPPSLRPLATVRDQVSAAWKADQRNTAAAKAAQEVLAQLKLGDQPAALAQTRRWSLKTTVPITRYELGKVPEISPELLVRLFALRVGESIAAATLDRKGHVVARLKEIRAPEMAQAGEVKTKLRTALEQAMAGDLLVQYQNGLAAAYDVKVNRAALDSLF